MPASLSPSLCAAGLSGSADPQLQKNIQERQQYIQKQQRWLLFLRHCAKCQQSEEECQFARSCRVGKELWQHILKCSDLKCSYPRCVSSKDLLKHHQKCNVSGATRPVGGFFAWLHQQQQQQPTAAGHWRAASSMCSSTQLGHLARMVHAQKFRHNCNQHQVGVLEGQKVNAAVHLAGLVCASPQHLLQPCQTPANPPASPCPCRTRPAPSARP